MKRIALFVGFAALLLIVGSCSSTRFIVDHDTRHDFSGYSSYAWFKLAPPPDRARPPSNENTILTRRIRWAVDGELAGRGLEKTELGEADFLVSYMLVLRARMVMYHTGWSVPMGGRGRWGWGGWGWGGWGWGAGWGGGRSSLETFTEGTIVVDVLDPDTRTLVWRGVIERAFRKPNPDDEKIRKLVARVMQDFPPL
jgi:hypothetical protein